jgi:aminoglycoside phosphotransferase family enzyme/predicted kinase
MNKVLEKQDFATLLEALSHPGAFPRKLDAGERILIRQTHASAVLLAGERAYKVKKPENFGFFDYSTPAARRHYCLAEARLNARLAPEVYLGVAPVLQDEQGVYRFGETLSGADLPAPGERIAGGRVVDYAVVMVRLPDEATLAARVRAGTATATLLQEVGRRVAAFHRARAINSHITSFGALDVIAGNWRENFKQMRPYIGRTLDQATFDQIEDWVLRTLDGRAELFAERVQAGRIRDCHGDLRPQHIYAFDELEGLRLEIIDCIEFNERFRYSDVAAEVAFLTMELDAVGRPDLSRAFVDAYMEASGDAGLRELLPFYSCYRACVRGKVLSFQLDEPEVGKAAREEARQRAQGFFQLAVSSAHGPTRPVALLIGGLMGTGKSTLAQALGQELGWRIYSSDGARKRLLAGSAAETAQAAFGAGGYSAEWTERTYAALADAAASSLKAGHSVILDATWSSRAHREQVAAIAATHGAQAIFLECVCPRPVALDRLRGRWQAKVSGALPSDSPSVASDGRPELHDAQAASWQAYDENAEDHLRHVSVHSARPVPALVEEALEALDMPRQACCLRA